MLFAVTSGVLFILRGIWMMMDSAQLQKRWVKVLPHINDTLLLGCAIALTVILQQYPFVDHWLTAKVIALVLYILVGTVAIKRGKTKKIRVFAFVVGLLLYGYIVGVAINHDVLSFLA
ncbi:regulator SirB [Gammaproteobacteria bacterium 42_54_T18]|nr:regulator SirB [Gammaproteobacteria bacterium 42_54_T18]